MSGRFLLRRMLQLVPTVAGILLAGFLLVHVAPGDPVVALAGEHADAAYYATMRARFGLDQPLPAQLATYAARVVAGDLGVSYVQGRDVALVIAERVPATLLLTGTALLLALVIAVPLGAIAGRHPRGVRDLGIGTVAIGLHSVPVFFVGQLAILLVAVWLGIAPVQGMADAGSDAAGAARALDVLRHLALPACVLASHELAVLVRLTRAGVLDEMTRDHVRTARAKGVSERGVLLRHVLPRALLPVLAVVGGRVGQLVAGAVVVETVFGWPGVGRLLVSSIQARDTPLLLGLFLAVAFGVVLANLLADVALAALDPRARLR